jgi:hypothetical protein
MQRFAPSPAMVVSLIALFVALGGTSYAALTLPKNSVGTKQLKNGAVTAAKISGSALAKAKAVGAAGAPAYENSWGTVCCGDESASFYKDPWGIVHLQGNVNHSGATTDTIFTLPVGDRPAHTLYFSAYGAGGSPAYIEITSSGAVIPYNSQHFIGLSDISFRAGL